MDAYAIVRTFGALALVLGLMFVALWAVRRFNLRVPGQAGGAACRRLELIERTPLDGKRSVALLRRDGREHLILLAPEGNLVIESAIRIDAADRKAQAEREVAAEQRRQAQQEAMAAARSELARHSQQLARAAARTVTRLRETGASRIHHGQSQFVRLLDTAAARRSSEAA